jgi:hypothetical protein
MDVRHVTDRRYFFEMQRPADLPKRGGSREQATSVKLILTIILTIIGDG